MTTAVAIIDELNALGVALLAQGDKLRFYPRSAVSSDLLARLQTHKPDLLRLLAAGPQEPMTTTPGAVAIPKVDAAPVGEPATVSSCDGPRDDDHDAADWSEPANKGRNRASPAKSGAYVQTLRLVYNIYP